MPQTLVINVDDVDDKLRAYGAGALVRAERADTETGSYAEVVTAALVLGTAQYELDDPSGTTDHWYRTRYTSSAGGVSSTYSDPFRGGSLISYASLTDLLEVMDLPDHSRDNALADLLVDGAELIDTKCGRRFYRSPQVSGTKTTTFPIRRDSPRLSSALGYGLDIVSITSLEIASYPGGTYTTIAAGDTGYYLREPDYPGWPHEDVELTTYSSLSCFPRGGRLRLVWAEGFASVPGMVKRANLEWAQEQWRRSGQGGTETTAVEMSDFYQVTDIGSRYVKRSWAAI